MKRSAVLAIVLLAIGSACGGDEAGTAGQPAPDPDLSSVATEPRMHGTSAPPATKAVDSSLPTTQPESASPGLTVTDAAPVGEPQEDLAAGSVRLWVSNQSFEDDPVAITIRIDDVVVVKDSFAVESQHNWIAFDIAGLTPGVHQLVAESGTGARTEGSFTLPEGERRWLVADYWYYAGDAAGRFFTVTESDEPVAFA